MNRSIKPWVDCYPRVRRVWGGLGVALSLFSVLLVSGFPALGVAQDAVKPPLPPVEKVPETPMATIHLRGQQTVQVFPLDLPTLVNLIENKNLDIAIAQAQINQAKGYFNQALADLFPSIRSYNYVEKFLGGEIFIGPIPLNSDRVTYQGRISADYSVQLGGKDIYQIQAMKHQLKRSRMAYLGTVGEKLMEAMTAYFTLLRDIAVVEASRQGLKEAEAQLQFNQVRLNAGFATRLDVTQSEVLQAERKTDVLKAENQRELSAINLGVMLNLPLMVRIDTGDDQLRPLTFVDESIPLSQLYEAAKENRPDIKQLELQIKEAKARYGASRADLFPTLNLSMYKRGIGPGLDQLQEGQDYMASINFDILKNMGWAAFSNMQIERARIQEAILNKAKQLAEIQKTLAQAYEEVQLYKAMMETARQKRDAAMETYKIAGAKLKHGFGTNLEVVEAEKALMDARIDYINAILNYNIAQVKLLYETGQLSPRTVLFGLGQNARGATP